MLHSGLIVTSRMVILHRSERPPKLTRLRRLFLGITVDKLTLIVEH